MKDADGHFKVDIPPGTVGVTISVVGYVLSKREVKVGPKQTVDLTIPLTEGTGSYTEEVRVTGERNTRTETGVPTEQTLGSADSQNLNRRWRMIRCVRCRRCRAWRTAMISRASSRFAAAISGTSA